MDETLRTQLADVGRSGRVVFLTGAGISAESGIPTFRGKEGYWTVGSRDYHPQEMATRAMYRREPATVWPWYLYRRSVCRAAAPNPAHDALVALEAALGDRFVLVTQNVDGLHLRAGNSLERTWQIHGNVDYMRCGQDCHLDAFPIPPGLDPWPRDRAFDGEAATLLRCPRCDALARPHVLWFDEMYDEARYRFESSLRAAAETDLLVIVGTAGATNLPNLMAQSTARNGGTIIDINPDDNVFAQLARRTGGVALTGSAGQFVPQLAAALAPR